MSEDLSQGASEIQTLLGERQRLQEWLARLEGATDAPAKVRQRVRADYEGRLTELVARLRGFSTTLSTSLTELQGRLRELQSNHDDVEEERAEAALRHAVGEYSDQDWQRVDVQCRTRLEGLAQEIGTLSDEIARLEDVLRQITPSAPPRSVPLAVEVIDSEPVTLQPQPQDPGREPTAVHDPDQGHELAAAQDQSRGRPVEAPRFTPRSSEPRSRERGRTIRFPQQPRPPEPPGGVDEMTFLKSVALDSSDAEEAQARQKGSAAKTLKCTDCGAMNRPTEWYCERCGAELAAL
jgi:hypothetical protein